MPYDIRDTGKSGPARFAIIKKATGKVVAHAGSKHDADLYAAKAEGADKFGDTPVPKLARVDGVELFDVGTHKGKDYGPQHIDTLVDNFNKLSAGPNPKLRVPMVLGHEENQELLDNTGLPAAGWLERVYKKGTKLVGDFGEVPEQVARLINQRAYRKVSVEMYDNFADQGQAHGVTLRRVALLGGEVPQVKSLDDVPLAKFSEQLRVVNASLSRHVKRPTRLIFAGVRRSHLQTTIFSEVSPMDRSQMLAALKQMGFNTDLLTDAVPDTVIAELLAALQGGSQGGAPGAAQMSPADQNAPPANSQLSDSGGVNPTYTATGAAKDPADQTAGGTTPSPIPSIPSKAQPTKVTLQFSEVESAITRIVSQALQPMQTQIQAINQQSAQRLQNEKRANIDAFCERMVKAGKLLPAQLDRGADPKNPKPNIKDVLLAADANPVSKFGEKTVSQLDLLMQTIENGPTVARFSERLSDPAGQQGNQVSEDRRKALLGHTVQGRSVLAKTSKGK